MRNRCLFLLALLPLCGCKREYNVAPVSGRVTLDGKPLADAFVHFAPVNASAKASPGPTSQGKTDADGRFTLTLDIDRKPGAVVGPHKVYIITVDTQAGPTEMADAGVKPKRREILPERYNQDTKLTFDVPPGGSTAANFDLKLKP